MAISRKEAVEGDALHSRTFRTKVSRADFAPDFVFGVATSAYQIEGACKEGCRGASIWDAFSHTEGNITDGSNGDVAVDHYHRYKEDIDILSKFGFSAYRFSIAWPHIFPDGLGVNVNMEGIAFYNDLINYIIEKGIKPCVTLYHWDLPLHLHESIGGWPNKQIVEYFLKYAEAAFQILVTESRTGLLLMILFILRLVGMTQEGMLLEDVQTHQRKHIWLRTI